MTLLTSQDTAKLVASFATLSQAELTSVGRTLRDMAPDSAAAKFAHKQAQIVYAQRFLATAAPTKADALLAIEPAPEVSAVADGTYTIVLSDREDYVTLRVETVANGNLAGKRIVSLLIGSDNERDFQGFGFANDTNGLALWKKFQGVDKFTRAKAAWAILTNSDSVAGYQEAYAIKSGRCSRCGRKLTVPASLHRGMGPECATK